MLLSILERKLVHADWHILQLYKCSLTTYTGTGILEKVSIEYPSIVGKKRQLPSTLFD